jgi:hypothetical protein
MEGSVLSFLKAEWKVSDTGSAHWASSLFWDKKNSVFYKLLMENIYVLGQFPQFIKFSQLFWQWTRITCPIEPLVYLEVFSYLHCLYICLC